MGEAMSRSISDDVHSGFSVSGKFMGTASYRFNFRRNGTAMVALQRSLMWTIYQVHALIVCSKITSIAVLCFMIDSEENIPTHSLIICFSNLVDKIWLFLL